MIGVASTTTIPPSPATRRSQLLPFRKPPQTGRSAPQLSVVFLSVCYGKAERRAEPQRPASYRPKGHEGRGTHTGPDRSRHARVFEGAAVGGRGAGGLGSGTVAHLGMGLAARTWPGICRRLGVPASAVFADPARILVGTGTGLPIGTGVTTAASDPPAHLRRPRPPARHARARRPAGGGPPRGPRRHPLLTPGANGPGRTMRYAPGPPRDRHAPHRFAVGAASG